MASITKTLTVTSLSSGGPDRVNVNLTEQVDPANQTPGGQMSMNLNLSNADAAGYDINSTASLTLTANAPAPAPAKASKPDA